jgi:hypothetical protein
VWREEGWKWINGRGSKSDWETTTYDAFSPACALCATPWAHLAQLPAE